MSNPRRIKMLGVAVPLAGLNLSLMLDIFTDRPITQGSIILSLVWIVLMLGSAYHDWKYHGKV